MEDAGFYDIFASAAEQNPNVYFRVSSAVRPGNISLADTFKRGCGIGRGLVASGIKPGDVVAAMLPPWVEWLTACVAAAYAGAVFMPVVSIYKARELGFILRQSRARILITPKSFRGVDYLQMVRDSGALPDLMAHYVTGDSSDAAEYDRLFTEAQAGTPAKIGADQFSLLVYTSGTTAHPKGVKHSARTIMSELHAQAQAKGTATHGATLSPWPPGHIAGALSLLRFLATGAPVVAMDQWDPHEAARLVEESRATASSGTPFHMSGLMDAAEADGRDLSSLQHYALGAAPVPAALVKRCEARGICVVHSYGSSEHPTVTMGAPDDPLEARLFTEGRVMAGSEIMIVDERDLQVPSGQDGEILTRGPERFLGYFDSELDKAAFLSGGWYRSGDIGHLDGDGFLHITDRKKDIIIRGGENISSCEIEDVMREIPGVVDAAAVASPDDRLGEQVMVFYETDRATDLTLREVIDHFHQAGLARQKTPERLQRIEALPRNATGKILKAELRQNLATKTRASKPDAS